MMDEDTSETTPFNTATELCPEVNVVSDGTHIRLEVLDDADEEENQEGKVYMSLNKAMLFADEKRRVDFVLVYRASDDKERDKAHRSAFLAELMKEGVEVETVDDTENDSVVFLRLYASWDVMTRYAEVMKLRKPMIKVTANDKVLMGIEPTVKKKSFFRRFFERFDFQNVFFQDPKRVVPLPKQFTWPFSLEKEYLFNIPKDRDTFFSSAERSLVIDYILRRTNFSLAESDLDADAKKKNQVNFGVQRLITLGAIEAAFPLHEPLPSSEELKDTDWTVSAEWNTRRMLYETWARLRNIFKMQPINYVRLYYGERIAFYFAWLGFYTHGLIFASIAGILATVYSLWQMTQDPVTQEVCTKKEEVLMCPLCSAKGCNFWKLGESCKGRMVAALLDNTGNMVFAILMSLWASIFFEFWKRKQSKLAYKWNVQDLDAEDEPPRPEFLALADRSFKSKVNVISGREEPFIPFWRHRVPIMLFSVSSVFLLVILALSFLIGVIIYKIVMLAVFRMSSQTLFFTYASIFTSITASSISLLIIIILNKVYMFVAVWLTNQEHHRTQGQYDNSVTLKLFLLNFVNFYAPVFYIAFVQGKTSDLPGSDSGKLLKNNECSTAGCMPNLAIQMCIILVGKQIMSSFKEFTIPRVKRFIRRYFLLKGQDNPAPLSRYYRDLVLVDSGPRPLYEEYLEMMVQFGFITVFVPAFPLAPLLALLNNIFELRLDADKFISMLRRPVAKRVKDIGIWLEILSVIARVAVVSNAAHGALQRMDVDIKGFLISGKSQHTITGACIIAFNTDFIARYVYIYNVSKNHTLDGYLEFSMSYMNISRFPDAKQDIANGSDYCRYFQHRTPPWDEAPYTFTATYWRIVAARFIFVFAFENIVFIVTSLIAYMIPDYPENLRVLIRRETNLTNEVILKAELGRREADSKLKNISHAFKRSVRQQPTEQETSVASKA